MAPSTVSYGPRIRVISTALMFSIMFFTVAYYQKATRAVSDQRLPPLYENFRKGEQELTHYDEYRRKPIKFFWAPNHPTGWGNVMQDYIMMSLLAHATNRSFVFNDYVWNPDSSLYSDFNGKLIPSRVPLSALISGPMVGSELPAGANSSRAVSRDFFRSVCPKSTVLHVPDINTDHLRYAEPAKVVLDAWVDKINSINDPCLQLGQKNKPIFEYWFYGQKDRLLSIWPSLSVSPAIVNWKWSILIYDAYENNRHVFDPTISPPVVEGAFNTTSNDDYNQLIPGLLVLHVRRGDFEAHCKYLCHSHSDWNAFNSFPEFVDRYPSLQYDEVSNGDQCLSRCFPSIEQIVAKVKQVRLESKEPLNHVYIMTNGAVLWVEKLREALLAHESWDVITSTRDLELTWEQKFVAQALDMFVAQRAQVLIGNGWSSLTSNVVMLRMAHGVPPNSNRFW
ncbi:hypothetical protein BJ138DRAFT_1114220 [Hygrophoropsis aurantiaca]|uniref:Uncharacterized protein n=1 Tax=Hygrophoropsis aurantiaca TaxID=72124 RepID=A0ACB8AC46_9AGAM|nr:hypothetical protein BJ138DRAFT_1114220 [Hygrophoropsis aurantiaca]